MNTFHLIYHWKCANEIYASGYIVSEGPVNDVIDDGVLWDIKGNI